MGHQSGSGLRLLSFDGCGQYCLPQLLVLGEIMHRIGFDLQSPTAILPCDYFDLIAGVEMGGLIAALLVVFRLSVDEAIEEYASISAAVYATGVTNDADRDTILRKKLGALFQHKGIPLDTQLAKGGSGDATCKLLLCAVNVTGTLRPFRNYAVRRGLPSEVTIIDATLATCTFSSVFVGKGYKQEVFMRASLVINNPTKEAISDAHDLSAGNARIACALSIGARPGEQTALQSSVGLEVAIAAREEQVADETAQKMAHLGFYFRFRPTWGPLADVPFVEGLGTLESIVSTYLQDTSVSTAVDRCVSRLERRLGVRKPVVNLPKLTGHFVMREEPWLEMKRVLIEEPGENDDTSQRIMVISGMGGSGKTQLARKFAIEFKDRYHYICFVDGSSPENIEADLTTYVLSQECDHEQPNLSQALGWFTKTIQWLIIFDNVDKPLDLHSFLPQCHHGSILVTTRLKTHGQLSPKNHYELKAMSVGEAVDALLRAALPAGSPHSPDDRQHAEAIVSELGYLPVAIIQAGSYILQRKCLPQYLSRLRSKSRPKLLRGEAAHQIDGHCNSVYKVLDMTRTVLLEKVQKCLHLISYFHFTNIPYSMILFAAQHQFSVEVGKYLDRPVESSKAIDLLNEVLGGADEEELDDLLITLQAYSLVETDWISDQKVIRVHPMVRAWAQDLPEFEDAQTYRNAAVRILSNCAGRENKAMHRLILPHVRALSPHWPCLHPNDKAAFADVLWQFSPKSAVDLWKEVHDQVKASPNTDELDHAKLLLKLGKGYVHAGPLSDAEPVDRQALEIRARLLGSSHSETIKAQAYLGFVYFALGRYQEAEKLQAEVLRLRRKGCGEEDLDTIAAAAKLALTLSSLGRPVEAMYLQEEALERRLKLLKEEHPDAITSMSNLATTYTRLGRHADAERLRVKVLELRKKVLGEDHIDTIISSENLSVTFYSQERYSEARELQEDVLRRYETIFEPGYVQTALGMSNLALTYCKLGMITEAEGLARRAEKFQRRVLKPAHVHYKQTLALLEEIQTRKLSDSCQTSLVERTRQADEAETKRVEDERAVLGNCLEAAMAKSRHRQDLEHNRLEQEKTRFGEEAEARRVEEERVAIEKLFKAASLADKLRQEELARETLVQEEAGVMEERRLEDERVARQAEDEPIALESFLKAAALANKLRRGALERQRVARLVEKRRLAEEARIRRAEERIAHEKRLATAALVERLRREEELECARISREEEKRLADEAKAKGVEGRIEEVLEAAKDSLVGQLDAFSVLTGRLMGKVDWESTVREGVRELTGMTTQVVLNLTFLL